MFAVLESLLDDRIVAVREEPEFAHEPYQLDVSNVKRCGEWFDMELRNLVRVLREACYDQRCPGWNADTLETYC